MQSAFLVTGCLGEEGGGIATLDLNGFDTVTWRFLKHDQGAYLQIHYLRAYVHPSEQGSIELWDSRKGIAKYQLLSTGFRAAVQSSRSWPSSTIS